MLLLEMEVGTDQRIEPAVYWEPLSIRLIIQFDKWKTMS